MATAYANSYLTIAATGSATSCGGCLFQRWHETDYGDEIQRSVSDFHNGRLVAKLDTGVNVRYLVRSHHQFNGDLTIPMQTAPLLTHAWVFQERLLSTWILHFHAEEMIWECQEESACECGYFSWTSKQELLIEDSTPSIKTSSRDSHMVMGHERTCLIIGLCL